MTIIPASIPSPEVSSFTLGPFTVHFYALCILAGIIVATWLTHRRLTARGAEPGVILDIILWAVPFGILGARVFHVLTHPNDYFGADAEQNWWAIWEGGIAIFGALIGGAVGAAIGCRMSGIRFWSFADALAPGMLIAQAFGRFGNWFNHELYGTPTTLPWGLEIESSNPAYPVGLPAETLFHPTFLYEVIWNLLGATVLLLLDRRFRLEWGKLFSLYLIWYGLGRTVWESIRIDPSEVFLGLRVNVWAAILAIVLGIVIFTVQSRRHTGLVPSPYVPGRAWRDPDADVESGDTDSDYVDLGDDAPSSSTSDDADATSATGKEG